VLTPKARAFIDGRLFAKTFHSVAKAAIINNVSLYDAAHFVRSAVAEATIDGECAENVDPSCNSRMTGIIVANHDELASVWQDVGRGKIVGHRCELLDTVPAVGDVVCVHYQNGRGTVTKLDVEQSHVVDRD